MTTSESTSASCPKATRCEKVMTISEIMPSAGTKMMYTYGILRADFVRPSAAANSIKGPITLFKAVTRSFRAGALPTPHAANGSARAAPNVGHQREPVLDKPSALLRSGTSQVR